MRDYEVVPAVGALAGLLAGVVVFAAFYNFLYSWVVDTPANTIVLGLISGYVYGRMLDLKTKWICLIVLVGILCGMHPAFFVLFFFCLGYSVIGIVGLREKKHWMFSFWPILGAVEGYLFHLVRSAPGADGTSAKLWVDMMFGVVGGSIPFLNVGIFTPFSVVIGIFLAKGNTVGHWLSAPFFIVPLFTFAGYGAFKTLYILFSPTYPPGGRTASGTNSGKRMGKG